MIDNISNIIGLVAFTLVIVLSSAFVLGYIIGLQFLSN